VAGYSREEATHMGVARAVAEGEATVGLGIQAAASAYKLDFVQVCEERYDLVVPAERWDDGSLRALRSVVSSPRFKQALVALGGYDVTQTGQETRLE
jgi:putative molybdopterin biosynthesis protein